MSSFSDDPPPESELESELEPELAPSEGAELEFPTEPLPEFEEEEELAEELPRGGREDTPTAPAPAIMIFIMSRTMRNATFAGYG